MCLDVFSCASMHWELREPIIFTTLEVEKTLQVNLKVMKVRTNRLKCKLTKGLGGWATVHC